MTTNVYSPSNCPDYVERKGSLFLRSDHMNYSRATKNSNWHQAREAEPKDYDLNKHPTRDLCKATYDRIGNVTDGTLPSTTYQAFSEEVFLKKDFTEQEFKKHMIDKDTCQHMQLDRDTGSAKQGFGSILPHHKADYDKFHFETTHNTDYKSPFPYTPAEEKAAELEDHSTAYKRCHSQFTDTSDYRRQGRNTWQDESGMYANSHLKVQAPVYKKTCPIAERLA